jgi:hypothetical protein
VRAGLSGVLFFLATGVHPAYAQQITTSGAMKEMPARERTAYILGVIDGLAYARFRKDTIAKGQKDETGMNCIYRWSQMGSLGTLLKIEKTFGRYPDQHPLVLIGAMVKKECGE